MTTRDHVVPQMYLRRFARKQGKRDVVVASSVDAPQSGFLSNVRNVAARRGFYWGEDAEGVPHHDVELLLGKIESAGSRAFSALLDDRRYALPRGWPIAPKDRQRMAWWIAAQILRSNRQRRRLACHPGSAATAPEAVRSYVSNNSHLDYLTGQLGAVAAAVHDRPWCLVFSDCCLITSDVPVLILNGQDDPDQYFAASVWDIAVPLDPHRLLLMPSAEDLEDRRKRQDHRAKFDGGLGTFFNQAIYDAADRQVFFHPDHCDTVRHLRPGARLPAPSARLAAPRYAMEYSVLADDYTVARRWVDGVHGLFEDWEQGILRTSEPPSEPPSR